MTPTAGSNFSRYKIPDDLNPSGICCICVPVPDDVEWRAQFMGALWRLSLQTHYQRDEAKSGKIVAARWRQVWTEVQAMTACCGGVVEQITQTTIKNISIQTYLNVLKQQWIDASFDVTVAFFATPAKFDSDPADVGDEIATRQRALCIMVESFIYDLMNEGVDFVEKAVIGLTVTAVGGLAIPTVPTWLVAGAFSAAAFAAVELHSQLTDQAYRDYLVCGMYDALKNESSNSRDAFSQSLDNLPVRPPPPQSAPEGIARDFIEAWIRSQLNNLDTYLGFVSQLEASRGIASALSDSDCACAVGWEHCFDFTVSDGGWIDDPARPDFDAFYTAGVGWQVNQGPGQSFGIALAMTKDADFQEFCITTSGPTVLNKVAVVEPMGSPDVDCISANHTQENCTFVTFNCDLDFTTQALKVLMTTIGSGLRTVSSVCFRGVGTNPFI